MNTNKYNVRNKYYSLSLVVSLLFICLFPNLANSQNSFNEYKGIILSISFKKGFGETDYNGIAKVQNNNKAYELDLLYYSAISKKISIGAGFSQMAYKYSPEWNVSSLLISAAVSPFNSYDRFRILPQFGYSLKLGDRNLEGFTARIRTTWNTRLFKSDLINLFIGYYLQQSKDQIAYLIVVNPDNPNPTATKVRDNVIYQFYSVGITFNF